ncbi:MAG TPA: hypothetical protein VGR85_08050 [Candidatus Limnocylindria bacterium]|nr:hypothetical protein [Candidatus Limnocylindria bacterium]
MVALLIGVGVRLYLAVAYEGNFDQVSFEIVAGIVRRGGNVYAETTRYNYTPVWAILLGAFDGVARLIGQPLHAVVRSTLTLVDVVNALLIGRIALRYAGMPVSRGFATYLLNPVAILIVGYHGQFETLAALPLLLAIAAAPARGSASAAWRWLLGAIALIVKHIVVFQVWVLFWYSFSARKQPRALLFAVVLFAATFMPYLDGGVPGIYQNVFLYGGLAGLYGIGSFLPRPLAMLVFVVVMAAIPVVSRRAGLSLAAAMCLSGVAFIATVFGIGEQYFLIPIIFGGAFGGRWFWLYTTAATLFLLASPNNVGILSLPPLWNLVWIAAVAWLAALIYASARRSAGAESGGSHEPLP